jgi:hypothetical protein
MIIGIVTYIFLSLGVALLARDRNLGMIPAFLISLFLTPITGLFAVIHSPKLILYHIVQHECPECGYSFDKNHDACPICLKDGKYVPLHPNIVPTT